jgi:hypothetical protein
VWEQSALGGQGVETTVQDSFVNTCFRQLQSRRYFLADSETGAANVENEDDLVKVHFDLAEPDMGMSGESLWAAPVGLNLYELRNSPWHVRNVNWLDVVEAIPRNENEWPEFVRVHKRSGHRTIHVYILDAGKIRTKEILDNCNRLGSTYENMDGRMYALDFQPGIDVAPAIEYLESLKAHDLADWRINECE